MRKKSSWIVLSLAVVYLALATTAQAQIWERKTVVTINRPIEVPGDPAIVLGAGTYVMKLVNSPGARSFVQFFNEDETKLYATVMGIPSYRLQPSDKSVISFYEVEPGRAVPIRAWFYPGDLYGVEFIARTRQNPSLAPTVDNTSERKSTSS